MMKSSEGEPPFDCCGSDGPLLPPAQTPFHISRNFLGPFSPSGPLRRLRHSYNSSNSCFSRECRPLTHSNEFCEINPVLPFLLHSADSFHRPTWRIRSH